MDNYELEMTKPPVTCYLHHAYPLTAAMAHKDFYPWFFSNYIQLEYNQDIHALNFFTCVICGNCIYVPILDYKILDLEFLFKSNTNIIDFIINSIDMGYYVTTYLDQYFVPDRTLFQKKHIRHEEMILGYDSVKELFKIVGYNSRGIYSKSNISFSEFEASYINSISKTNDVILFKAKDSMSYKPSFEFDIINVKNLLKDYLLSKDTTDNLRIIGNPKSGYVYGIQVYKGIIKYIQLANENNNPCDIKIPYLLWEHKKAMVSRIEYLIENKYLASSNELLTAHIGLQHDAERVKNMILKYNVTYDKKLIETTINSLQQMYNKEIVLIEDLLNKLA